MHIRTDGANDSRRIVFLGLMPTLAAALCMLFPAPSGAQVASGPPSPEALADSLNDAITRATYRGDLDRLGELHRLAERAEERYPERPWFRYYRAYALYRLGTLHLQENEDRADEMLEEAQEVLESTVRQTPTADGHALLSSVIAVRISVSPMVRGISMGPEADEQMESALEIDRDNPRPWLLRGISAFNTPGMFGGGTDKAQRFLEKSVVLFEGSEPEPPAPSWGEVEARAWLGQVYAEQGETEKARSAYRDALCLEPDYEWVRRVLLPRVAGGGTGGG